MLVRATPWAARIQATWFGLRCGPKDQPSLWHLVLRAAGRDGAAATDPDAFGYGGTASDDASATGAGLSMRPELT